MSLNSPVDAFEVIRFSLSFQEKLENVYAEIATQAGTERERRWLADALEVVSENRSDKVSLLEAAQILPDLGEIREELVSTLQEKWVDALEKLLAGITFHGSSRSPLIEALFPHQKFAALRRADEGVVAQYAADFNRRVATAYVQRMFADPTYAFASAVLDTINERFNDWQRLSSGADEDQEAFARLRESLSTMSFEVERTLKQARALVDAALVTREDLLESSGVAAKPRKRGKRSAELSSLSNGLLNASSESTTEETALELAAVSGSSEAVPEVTRS